MAFSGFFKQDEVSLGVELCKEFCRGLRLSPDECMTKNPDGTCTFGVSNAMPNKARITIYFSVLPSQKQNDPNTLLVWTLVTPIENVPPSVREEFFRQLLTINILEGFNCYVGIDRKNYIIVKTERVVHCLDISELQDMIFRTFDLATTLHIDICPRFKIPTMLDSDSPSDNIQQKQTSTQETYQQISPAEALSQIQRDIINAIECGDTFFQTGNFSECYKKYYQTAYNILNSPKIKVKNPVLETIQQSIERAMADIHYYPEDQKKCLMFRNIFDEILKMKV